MYEELIEIEYVLIGIYNLRKEKERFFVSTCLMIYVHCIACSELCRLVRNMSNCPIFIYIVLSEIKFLRYLNFKMKNMGRFP